jgi:hypothetical protein
MRVDTSGLVIKYSVESGVDLTDDQRKQLALMIAESCELEDALKDAAKDWPLSKLRQVVNEDRFRRMMADMLLSEYDDDELIEEARDVAGASKVNDVLKR